MKSHSLQSKIIGRELKHTAVDPGAVRVVQSNPLN